MSERIGRKLARVATPLGLLAGMVWFVVFIGLAILNNDKLFFAIALAGGFAFIVATIVANTWS